jgi:hypothetical protein
MLRFLNVLYALSLACEVLPHIFVRVTSAVLLQLPSVSTLSVLSETYFSAVGPTEVCYVALGQRRSIRAYSG